MSLIRVTNFLKRLVDGNKLIIGRWNPMIDDAKKEERALRSTYDHCGDSICGKPDEVKILMKEPLKKRYMLNK